MNTKKKKTHPDQPASGTSAKASPAGDVAGVGNVDKIRDILFGAQMREYERKFSHLEDRVAKATSQMREEATRRFEALESYVEKEFDAVGERLKKEQADRERAFKDLADDARKNTLAVEEKLNALEDKMGTDAKSFRQQILDQSKSLSEDIRKRTEETLEILDQRTGELGGDKVDRNGLSELLTEMALRLANGPSLGLDLDPEEFESD